MSSLDQAVLKHITYLVKKEYRPFCFKDLLWFMVDGVEYRMTHGTFQNKIHKLKKSGIIEVHLRDALTFYTLKGIKFQKRKKTVTCDRAGVHEDTFQRILA